MKVISTLIKTSVSSGAQISLPSIIAQTGSLRGAFEFLSFKTPMMSRFSSETDLHINDELIKQNIVYILFFFLNKLLHSV